MPIYEYEHIDESCGLGKRFELMRSMSDAPLHCCPECNAGVRKLISSPNISTPKTNSELRNLGFTKLVKRDDGVYENVTAGGGKNKMVIRDKPETVPDFSRTITD
jgi:putative FmdB family regulatory protein